MKESEYYKLLEDPATGRATEADFLNDPHITSVIEHASKALSTMQSIPSTAEAWFLAKWTCVGCGERIVATEKNTWHMAWHHEDCGEITLTIDGNLGYLIATPSDPLPENKSPSPLPVNSFDLPSMKGMFEWLKANELAKKPSSIDGHNRRST